MSAESKPKVLVVGAGIVGCAVARELAGCGCRVLLLERGRVGGEASSAAAGILCPQIDAEGPSPLLDLGLESLRLFPDYVDNLKQETGIDPEFDAQGTLSLNLTREDETASRRLSKWQREAGLAVEPVSAREVASLEAGLSGSILGGLFFPRGGQVDPVALTRALAISARQRGVEVREGCPVETLRESAGRTAGVVLPGGELLEADEVILAAGAWSSHLVPDLKAQVLPVRGQILVLETHRPPRRHVLFTPRAYLVPRRDGRLLAGSTTEKVGFRKAVTPRALMKLTASALSIDPTLEEASFVSAWSGLRPGTADGLPLLGEIRPGLMAATGHYRSGILLAPVTAALVAERVLRGQTSRSLHPFSPLRTPVCRPAGAAP